MFLRFTADRTIGNAEFEVSYSKHCAVIYRDAQMLEFDSVDRNDDTLYGNGLSCTWKIVGYMSETITLTIQSMDIQFDEQCERDYLKVFVNTTL